MLAKEQNTVAILGNGCAGAECLKALRESGYQGQIHIFSDSKWPVYNPTLTTYYLAGKNGFRWSFPVWKRQIFHLDFMERSPRQLADRCLRH